MWLVHMKLRDGVIVESVAVGFTTLAIGSALMLVPIKGVWWPFFGTFLIGFLAHLGYDLVGVNQRFCGRILGDA